MYGNKRWTMEFAGVLANDGDVSTGRDPIIHNRTGSLQYFLSIISVTPENFPKQAKVVTGFAEDLYIWGFRDDPTLTVEERKESLRDFLKKYVLFFQVELRRRELDEFYIAKNIRIKKKSDTYSAGTHLEAIPIFSEDISSRTKMSFEKQLYANKAIGDNKQISSDNDDTVPIILWENEESDYTVYGSFNKHEHGNGGFRFIPKNQIMTQSLDIEYVIDSYKIGNVLFIDNKIVTELEGKLSQPLEMENNNSTNAAAEENGEPTNEPTNKESEFMKIFIAECKKEGLYYNEKDLYNFHVAMKSGNLVILSGMSGTGKSKLVQCYANALKLKKDQLLFIPVRPFWQDDSDLIGHLDTLNNVYRPGDSGLIDTLIAASKELSDEIHIVCFDEMNLARVEHYFSQFLSVLEREESKRYLQLYNEKLASRTYNANLYEPMLKIGSNVIFVGTVNVDESTYHFSDKVLDRANVINLKLESYKEIRQKEQERLSVDYNENKNDVTYDFETYTNFRIKEREISLTIPESTLLWNINGKLQESNKTLGIGWRIVRQISSFLINLPSDSPLSREEAFDLQLVQRVLTKIRGSEEQFTELVGKYNPDSKEAEDSMLLELLEEMSANYTFEHTRKVVAEKSKELRLYGHTI